VINLFGDRDTFLKGKSYGNLAFKEEKTTSSLRSSHLWV